MKKRWIMVTLALALGCGDDAGSLSQEAAIDDSAINDALDVEESLGENDISQAGDVSAEDTVDANTVMPDSGTEADTSEDASQDDGVSGQEDHPLGSLPIDASHVLSILTEAVDVVFTEGNVPHIYASNRLDLQRVFGYVVARDRFFTMDLARRLGRGTLSNLVGEAGLDIDRESKLHGIPGVAEAIFEHTTAEMRSWVEAYCEGVNAYVADVANGKAEAPSEYQVAGTLLGGDTPSDVMVPFEAADVYAVVAYILYNTSFETGDVGKNNAFAALETLLQARASEEVWVNGVVQDIAGEMRPLFPVVSAAEFSLTATSSSETKASLQAEAIAGMTHQRLESGLASRVESALNQSSLQALRGDKGAFGSNAWAVHGDKTQNGKALFAGDGHLALGVPSILYQAGLDTTLLGDGNTKQVGLVIPGFPVLNLLTNGSVVWGQTQLMGDITDWYREEVQLDDNGKLYATRFNGDWLPTVSVAELDVVAEIEALGSEGAELAWERYETFDGRRIVDVEGLPANENEAEAHVFIGISGPVIPGDVDGDGVIHAVSFDYVGLDAGRFLEVLDGFGHSKTVSEFQEWTRGLVGYSQNLVAADSEGGIFYSGYQAVPCRTELERNEDGSWKDGAHPARLLDGTKYGAFRVSIDDDGWVVSGEGGGCVVPFGASPQTISPEQGYVLSANNDPGGMSLDGRVDNDPWYFGGPWTIGARAHTIDEVLAEGVASNDLDINDMADLQGNTHSIFGRYAGPLLIETLAAGKDSEEEAVVALWESHGSQFEEVLERLQDWVDEDCPASAGVTTTYHQASPEEQEWAVATMLFNAWFPRVVKGVFNDEGIPGVWPVNSSWGKSRTLIWMLESRGENTHDLASFDPATTESCFFDDRTTPEIESSVLVVHQAIADALTFLESEPTSSWEGGFGTADMEKWRWGLRHVVRFESLLLDLVGTSPEFAILAAPFSITSGVIPIQAEGEEEPFDAFPWFPRPGDNLAVDAANAGLSGTSFSYSSGPVMRMVVELAEDETTGLNVIPGGQSGLNNSPYFADQAKLWLGNEALPLRFSVERVLEGAQSREQFLPQAE